MKKLTKGYPKCNQKLKMVFLALLILLTAGAIFSAFKKTKVLKSNLTAIFTSVPEKEQPRLPNGWKIHTNNNPGINDVFTIEFPGDWFFPDNSTVLESYDDYLVSRNNPPPKDSIKCDFIIYKPEEFKFLNKQLIVDNKELKIYQENSLLKDLYEEKWTKDPYVTFTIEDKTQKNSPIILVCWSYADKYQPVFNKMLSTFKFIE